IVGDLAWVLGRAPGAERLVEFEAGLDRLLPKHDIVALCHYRRRKFKPAIIRGVLQTHPRVVFGGLVCANPYYVPPEEFQNPDEEAGIARLLRTLVDRERALENLRAASDRLRLLTRRLVTVQ